MVLHPVPASMLHGYSARTKYNCTQHFVVIGAQPSSRLKNKKRDAHVMVEQQQDQPDNECSKAENTQGWHVLAVWVLQAGMHHIPSV
jgi:hypothetical protein